jgi:dipeptidyl aminopeptidase/acylaminoacyl peptidase
MDSHPTLRRNATELTTRSAAALISLSAAPDDVKDGCRGDGLPIRSRRGPRNLLAKVRWYSEAERLTRPEKGTAHIPEWWSPRGDTLLYTLDNKTELTLWTLSLKRGQSTRFGNVRSVFPTGARFSPDGRWIAHAVAEQPGPTTIYVEPFPATGAKYELFVKSGNRATPHKPRWSVDRKELIYVPRFGEFEAVGVNTSPEFAFGNAARLQRSFNPGVA